MVTTAPAAIKQYLPKLLPHTIVAFAPIDAPISTMVVLKGSSEDVIEEFSGGLRSAMTYAGAMNLDSLRENADFIRITSAGLSEAHAYGTRNK